VTEVATGGWLRPVWSEWREAVGTHPVSWWVVLLPFLWFLASDTFYARQLGWGPLTSFAIGLIAQGSMIVVLRLFLPPVLHRLADGTGRKVTAAVAGYVLAGALEGSVLLIFTPTDVPFLPIWLLPVRIVSAVSWYSAGALMANRMLRARRQRIELTTEYERLLRTRGRTSEALAEADQRLAEVRTTTADSLAEISSRLDGELDAKALSDLTEFIDQVVSHQVRPVSHDLARMPDDLKAPEVERLWLGWRELLPALLRRIPTAHPFQPALVAIVTLPITIAGLYLPEPHHIDLDSLDSLAALATQMLYLVAAKRLLAEPLRKMRSRTALLVTTTVYLVQYLLGLAGLLVMTQAGFRSSLEPYLVPPLLGTLLCVVAALYELRVEEGRAAQRVIAQTDWDLRRTRQRLWAQRRRLALALHGRVQANLTAAGLVLRQAQAGLEETGELDATLIDRVRSTLELAAQLDSKPSRTVEERLALVTGVWAGILTVDLQLRPGGLRMLTANDDAADACVEVLREVLLNAVRHSEADRAQVVVGAVGPALIGLRVVEVAAGRTPTGGSDGTGVGSSLIDSLAVDWAVLAEPDRRITVALLAGGLGGALLAGGAGGVRRAPVADRVAQDESLLG